MKERCVLILLILFLGASVLACSTQGAAPAAQKRVVAYFADWSGSTTDHLRPDLLTHVIYAFAHFKDGACVLREEETAETQAVTQPLSPSASQPAAPGERRPSHLRRLQSLKERNPALKTLFSIGGWGGSGPFSNVARTDVSREKFARSCAALAVRHGFDGIDIDWEYPGGGGAAKGRPEDTRNFTLLLQELRRQLDAQGAVDGKRYLLTIATSASPQKLAQIEWDQVHPLVDFINVMTYDFAGEWSSVTGFNAPLFAADPGSDSLSVDSSLRAYIAAGVPRSKLLVGVPFYGRAFGGVANDNHGLGQPHDRKPPRPGGSGEWTYRAIAERYLEQRSTTTRRFWSSAAHVPWLYDQDAGIMITYDDPQSIRDKARYVLENDLGGVMIWELSQDDAESSLLRAVQSGLVR